MKLGTGSWQLSCPHAPRNETSFTTDTGQPTNVSGATTTYVHNAARVSKVRLLFTLAEHLKTGCFRIAKNALLARGLLRKVSEFEISVTAA